MTGEILLAVIGLSAGTGSVVGAWAALWWRDHVPYGHKQLLQHVYPYVDGRIGATTTENLRRAGRRFKIVHPRWKKLWPLLFLIPNTRKLPVRQKIADYLWPEVKLAAGGNPLPEVKRMGRYVQLEMRGDATFGKPYQLWNIQAVIVRPTSEVDALASGFVPAVARWVAWAMRLSSADQLEIDDPKKTLPLGYLRFARKGPAKEMPTRPPHAVGAKQ
jgi:hypothetical protein